MTKLTNEQIQRILDNAPDGAKYIDLEGDYIGSSNRYSSGIVDSWNIYDGGVLIPENNLSDLREILELRQEVERLKKDRKGIELEYFQHGFIEAFRQLSASFSADNVGRLSRDIFNKEYKPKEQDHE